jgi:hypothetical protein
MKYCWGVALLVAVVGCGTSAKSQNAELAEHPWWRVRMKPERVAGIIHRITKLQARADAEYGDEKAWACLDLTSSGHLEDRVAISVTGDPPVRVDPWPSDTPGHPTARLGGFLGSVWIRFFAGVPGHSRSLSEQEARDLLKRMLDQAHAIEQQESRSSESEKW